MKGIVLQSSIVREKDEGFLISDLHLASMLLVITSGTEALYAEKASGENSSRLLFYIKGDKVKLRENINRIFSGQVTGVEKDMIRLVETISYLKKLLDVRKEKPNNV